MQLIDCMIYTRIFNDSMLKDIKTVIKILFRILEMKRSRTCPTGLGLTIQQGVDWQYSRVWTGNIAGR